MVRPSPQWVSPRLITHLKRLRNVVEESDYFFRTLSVLEEKTGPVLFLFPKGFRADPARLDDFLTLIPKDMLCAFEFRDSTWRNGIKPLSISNTRKKPAGRKWP